ncbi:MAG: riboflavin synthase [Bacilli bacterium]
MFTGIVEEVGKLARLDRRGEAYQLTFEVQGILEDVKLGDSISVNGICLTVTHFSSHLFTVDAVPETVRQTNLSGLNRGSTVNLERAMKADGRFGGHFVSGHIDGTAIITRRTVEENAVVFTFSPDDIRMLKYIIPKGSVAIDGISLTVMGLDHTGFQVSVIPHTMEQTTLLSKQKGDKINLECDMIGKYIEKFVSHQVEQSKHTSSLLDERFLVDNGFM